MNEKCDIVDTKTMRSISEKKQMNNSEIKREATVRKIRTVQNEDDRDVARNLDFYNLDVKTYKTVGV